MRTATILTICLLTLAAVVTPVAAHHVEGHERGQDAERDERRDKAERKDAQERPDNLTKADKADRCRQHHNETGEVHPSCKKAAKKSALDRFAAKCREHTNETGEEARPCKAAKEAMKADKQARRAAEHSMKALFGLERRLDKLEMLEAKFEEKLAGDNVTANQTAAWEAKLDRIDQAQNVTQMRIDALQDRLDGLEGHAEARAHIMGKKMAICHSGDDGNHTIHVSIKAWPAHKRHGDVAGACAGDSPDDAPEGDDGSHDEEGDNSTVQPSEPSSGESNGTASPSGEPNGTGDP